MTVLLVDDQISILSGLISGLDWDALGVTAIRTASNAFQAKEILRSESVELLLCDIEMPGENGLSLLRWARREGMDFVCVFLTSHADFLYAKEAIQLNCFDYILQPARYEAIQATIAKAIARVKSVSVGKELEQYGALAKNNSAGLFQGIFSDWSMGRSLSVSALCDMSRQIGRSIEPRDDCFIIWGHLLCWRTEPWPTHEWVYAANNIVAELYGEGDYLVFPFGIDSTSLGWFIVAADQHFTQPERVLFPLNKAYSALRLHLPCDFAFYVSPVAPVEQINEQSGLLLGAKANNVLPKTGVFCPAQRMNVPVPEKLLDSTQLHRWEILLTEGRGATVTDEAFGCLEALAENGELTQSILKSFWLQFQQAVMNAAIYQGSDLRSIITVLGSGNSASSVQEIKSAVKELAQCFPAYGEGEENKTALIDRIKKYVEQNLDRPLNVNDVAAALFMNADYISRQFKAEEGVSLKEHIVHKKMEGVQHLLRTTSLPVSVIAAKMGYDNFSYFSQVYRKTMGISPTDERK